MERRAKLLLSCFIALLLILPMGCSSNRTSQGESLYRQANEQYERSNYTWAAELFQEAREELLAEGKDSEAADCRVKMQNMEIITLAYPYSQEDVRELFAQHFTDETQSNIDAWIAECEPEKRIIDGQPYYTEDVGMNLLYRNQDLFQANPQLVEKYREGYRTIMEVIDKTPPDESWQPYSNPATYVGASTLDVPREELPQSGLLQLWFSIPILTGPQPSVRVLSILPDDYVKDPPIVDSDMGMVYMEVPLEELEDDLRIEIQFTFDHYEQRFEVDPDNVGEYDTESDLYREYTASRGNTEITPEISDTARQVVGDETNPYLAAKMLYDYVVENVVYGHLPHLAMWPRGEPESVYVHHNHVGDCGAQCIYFTALCRAVGIPCRTTGGWQLLAGDFASHMWAEFYLPNYGWIPADTSVAQIPDYIPDLSEEENKAFKDFLFGGQDHYRCVVQTDMDIPLIPPASEMVSIPMVNQYPEALCDTMEGVPGLVLSEYFTIHLK